MIDRLASYAAREAENEDPEETKRQEEAAARRLAEKVKMQKDRTRERRMLASPTIEQSESTVWGSEPQIPSSPTNSETVEVNGTDTEKEKETEKEKGEEKEKEKSTSDAAVRKFRGVPEDVQLFEVFWKQVVELIKVCTSSPFS